MEKLNSMLASMTVFRGAAELPAVRALREALREARAGGDAERLLDAYGRALFGLRQEGADSFADYLRAHLLFDETPYALAVARGRADAAYRAAAERDLSILRALCALPAAQLKAAIAKIAGDEAYIASLPEWNCAPAPELSELEASYRKNGCGLFARGRAFHWERGQLTAVKNPDPTDGLIGYEWQREAVVQNTRALLAGRPCCNVLLHGDSGTGKSATIKSLLSVPEFFNLRIIEVAKNSLEELTDVQRLVSGHTQKFILYIDDLTFQQEDRGYSALKTALEGGLERRPDNVAIYVTSNRRHMVRETFSDRGSDDIHRSETIAEQTSLSDRFGLRLPYLSLGKPEYLAMIDELAARAGIDMPTEQLHAEANVWELRRGGRTPRSATQFIEHLQSQF